MKSHDPGAASTASSSPGALPQTSQVMRPEPATLADTPAGDDNVPRLPDGTFDQVTEASMESFPASDAPAWTPDRI